MVSLKVQLFVFGPPKMKYGWWFLVTFKVRQCNVFLFQLEGSCRTSTFTWHITTFQPEVSVFCVIFLEVKFGHLMKYEPYQGIFSEFKIQILLDVTPCSSKFSSLYLRNQAVQERFFLGCVAMTRKALWSFEALVTTHRETQLYVHKDLNLQQHCSHNLDHHSFKFNAVIQ
jgi:hypothetical protein